MLGSRTGVELAYEVLSRDFNDKGKGRQGGEGGRR